MASGAGHFFLSIARNLYRSLEEPTSAAVFPVPHFPFECTVRPAKQDFPALTKQRREISPVRNHGADNRSQDR
jgi:hypothetical protein